MALPEQIQKQSEAIQKLYEDMNDDAGGEAATADAAPVDPAADSSDVGAPPAAVIEPPPAGDPPAENYEQKYRSLQGMFNAEVPKLHATVKEQQHKIAQLENLMASFSTVPASQPSTAQTLLSDAEKAEYGDTLDVMRKVSREELHPLVTKLVALETALNNLATSMNTSILPQVRQVAEQQAITAEDRFWADLQREVPDWQQINNSEGFKSWLLTVDDLTGETRQTYLAQAQKRLDAGRVIAFFRAYTAGTGKPQLTSTSSTAQPNGSTSELGRQIAPARSRQAAPPANSNAKVYSPADIAKFFDDARKGLYKGREAEYNRIQADIFAAPREGRIA